MVRYDNLYARIWDPDNIRLAYYKARKGKGSRLGVILFEKDLEANILALSEQLRTKTYVTSPYHIFTIYEPKEREIYRLPFPDRVVHHAIMNVLEPIWVSLFSSSTFSCIKGRGIHGAERAVIKALRMDPEGTRFCLKGDIRKFYPSIDHDKLKEIIRRKIKDEDLLWLLDSIIDSAPGVPIGNYLSQYLANLYLAYFDHDLRTCFGLRDNDKALSAYVPEYIRISKAIARTDEEKAEIAKGNDYLAAKLRKSVHSLKWYQRYADDYTIEHSDKAFLHLLNDWIGLYFGRELKLHVKPNWQIFPIEDRGIDFVGYVFRHDYVLLRKSIKQRFFRKVARAIEKDPKITKETLLHTVCSYYGWCLHSDSKHLLQTIFNLLSDEVRNSLPKTVSVRGSRERDYSLQLQHHGERSHQRGRRGYSRLRV